MLSFKTEIKMFTNILFLVMSMTLVTGQPSSFSGSRPIGYPEGKRFDEGDAEATTITLPIEAKGDKDLVDRLSELPLDQQPLNQKVDTQQPSNTPNAKIDTSKKYPYEKMIVDGVLYIVTPRTFHTPL